MSNYRRAFVVAVAFNVLLAGGLAFVWWRSHPKQVRGSASQPQPAAVPASGQASGGEMGKEASNPSETPLVPVQLTPQRLQSIGVKTGVVEAKPVQDEIRTVGNVEVDETRLAYVQVRFPGWIQKVFADSTYQFVRKGQPLFTIYSPDLVSTEQEYLLARQDQKSFTEEMQGTASKEGDWLLQAAAGRLRQFGVPQREIESLEKGGQVQREIEIDSPVSGYITERNALPNQYVQAETKLYTIADLSTIWVYANVYQADVGRLKPGDGATVSVDAYPGRQFTGRIDQILPQVDMTTRTARVRLVLS